MTSKPLTYRRTVCDWSSEAFLVAWDGPGGASLVSSTARVTGINDTGGARVEPPFPGPVAVLYLVPRHFNRTCFLGASDNHPWIRHDKARPESFVVPWHHMLLTPGENHIICKLVKLIGESINLWPSTKTIKQSSYMEVY